MNLEEFFTASPGFRTKLIPSSLDNAGGKGAGLLRLPTQWYPPSIVISPLLREKSPDSKIDGGVLAAVSGLQDALFDLSAKSPDRRLLLRSNAELESIDDRGTFLSVAIEPTLVGLSEGMHAIWSDAASKRPQSRVGFLIQPNLHSKLSGHLSNEHRLSRESRRWVFQLGEQDSPWRVQRDMPAKEDRPLTASGLPTLQHALRGVARLLSDRPTRLHLEWVWDGEFVWLVQADSVAHQTGPGPGDGFETLRGDPVDATALKVWRVVSDNLLKEFRRWPKLNSLAELGKSGLGRPPFWLVRGDNLLRASTANLEDDLAALCSGHLLIRTDIAERSFAPNLPKSPATTSTREALHFLQATLEDLIAQGVDSEDVCFVAHRFTRARASAWAVAWPDHPNVRVDSIWGLADGLQYLPHDSAWVNVDTGRVDRAPVAKTDLLDIEDSSQKWKYRTTPSEWIWKYSATVDQLQRVGVGTSLLANHLRRPVCIMWFIGVLDGYDSDCLAWVRVPFHGGEVTDSTQFALAQRRHVQRPEDVESIRASGNSAGVIRLSPQADLLRDDNFLKSVISLTQETGMPVEMAGSSLAHAYYLMRKAGCTVLTSQKLREPSQSFDKLVRDGIITKIENRGERSKTYKASPVEKVLLIKRKLVEESIEVLEAESAGGVLEELADVEEVLAELMTCLGIDREEVVRIQMAKREKLGGFEGGVVLLETGGRSEPQELSLFSPDAYRRSGQEKPLQLGNGSVRFSLIPPALAERAPFELAINGVTVRGVYSSDSLQLEISQKRRSISVQLGLSMDVEGQAAAPAS